MYKEIFDKPIGVLGGGATAQTMAADAAIGGSRVHLYELPEFGKGIEKVIETRKIEIIPGWELNLKGFKRNGIAEIDVVTTNIEEALEGTGLIVVSIPSNGHESFFEKMIPYLKDGQVISIFPDNYGSLVLRKMLRDKGKDVKLVIGGWRSMVGATRLLEPGKVRISNRSIFMRGDTLPSSDWDDFRDVMRGFPPLDSCDIEKGDTVVGIGLENPNPPVHCLGVLLNIGAMENAGRPEKIYGDDELKVYNLYADGMSPSVAKVQREFYREEEKIAEAMGIKIKKYEDKLFMHRGSIMTLAYFGEEKGIRPFEKPFAEVEEMRKQGMMTGGPWTLESRYVTEDVPIGTVAAYSLARNFGVDTPVIESVIRLFSVACGRDFLKEGRSLDDMGLAGMSKDEMLKYLRESK